MTVQVVVGAGQVGAAHANVLTDAYLRDIEPSGPAHADVLHIAYPWDPAFSDVTRTYQRDYHADLVIVHSTVPVGTCDPDGWVHSPVRGRHPDLTTALKTFVKHVGGAHAAAAAELFADAGIPTHVHPRAADLEAGKLWELVQFGVQVRVCQQIHDWCVEQGVDFDVVYRQMAESYCEGYWRLGQPQFVRPVLEHVPGPIGGHCVVPGAAMLDHPLARMVTDG